MICMTRNVEARLDFNFCAFQVNCTYSLYDISGVFYMNDEILKVAQAKNDGYLKVISSTSSGRAGGLSGAVELAGAKNAVLVTIASLVLTTGKSLLHNV